jgi:hypothetical protein
MIKAFSAAFALLLSLAGFLALLRAVLCLIVRPRRAVFRPALDVSSDPDPVAAVSATISLMKLYGCSRVPLTVLCRPEDYPSLTAAFQYEKKLVIIHCPGDGTPDPVYSIQTHETG